MRISCGARASRGGNLYVARPPILIAGPEQPSAMQADAITRGVRYRSIADQAFLALSGVVARIRVDMEAGEEVRVVSEHPFKMVMADRNVALIPPESGTSQQPLARPLSMPSLPLDRADVAHRGIEGHGRVDVSRVGIEVPALARDARRAVDGERSARSE